MSSDRDLPRVTYAGKKRRPSVTDDVVEESEASASDKEMYGASSSKRSANEHRKPVDSLNLPGPEPRAKRPGPGQDLKKGDSSRSPKSSGKTIKPPSIIGISISPTSKQGATTRDNDANIQRSVPDIPDKEGSSRRTTEAERRSYLESHPDVAELEPHRVKCRCCDKWLKLSSAQKYALAPWKLHKKACTSESPCTRKPRLSTGHEGVSLASGAEDDDASSIAPSVSASDATGMSVTGRIRSSTDRQRLLEEDELSGEVRPDSIFCSACAKWVKLSTRTAYQLKNWVIHTERIHGRMEGSLTAGFRGGAPSNRVREAERKLKLVNDAQVRDFTASRVSCKACSADVTLSEIVPYQLENWLAHKAICPASLSSSIPTQRHASKPEPSGSIASLTLSREAKLSAPPSTTSTDLTCVATENGKGAVVSSGTSGQKRAREDDEGEEGSKAVRVRTSSYSTLDVRPTGPWGWLKLPWETFKRGFAEGLGAGRGEDANKEG